VQGCSCIPLLCCVIFVAGEVAPAEGGEGVASPSDVPMVTSVGPAGDFSGAAQAASAVEPANADVEVR
jgi:hypothetical protein